MSDPFSHPKIFQWLSFGRKLFLAIAIVMIFPSLFIDDPNATAFQIVVFTSPCWGALLLMLLHIIATPAAKNYKKGFFRRLVIVITLAADVIAALLLLGVFAYTVLTSSLGQGWMHR